MPIYMNFSLCKLMKFLDISPCLFNSTKSLQLSIKGIITENMLIISRPLKTVAVNNKKRNLFNVIAPPNLGASSRDS